MEQTKKIVLLQSAIEQVFFKKKKKSGKKGGKNSGENVIMQMEIENMYFCMHAHVCALVCEGVGGWMWRPE